jgi:hypothetical protein
MGNYKSKSNLKAHLSERRIQKDSRRHNTTIMNHKRQKPDAEKKA